jgi:hypothetical protein
MLKAPSSKLQFSKAQSCNAFFFFFLVAGGDFCFFCFVVACALVH